MSKEVEAWWNKKIVRKDKINLERALPDQFLLFELLDPTYEDYSQAIDIFDSIPWVVWSRKRSYAVDIEGNKFLKSYERKFHFMGKEAFVKIPAVEVADRKNKDKVVAKYPGQREWMVEKALRKLACSGEAHFDRDKMRLSFRFRQLLRTLEDMNIKLFTHQLKESLEILGTAKIEVHSDGFEFRSSILDFAKVEDEKGNDYYMVTFSSLISDQVLKRSYRLYNNQKLGSIGDGGSALAQWLYLRISIRYIQASDKDGYDIYLKSVMRDSPMEVSRKRKALEEIISAIETLKANNIISRYEEPKKVLKGRTLDDAKITIFASKEFVADMKKSNHRKKITDTVLPLDWQDDGGIIKGVNRDHVVANSRREAKKVGVDLESKNGRT